MTARREAHRPYPCDRERSTLSSELRATRGDRDEHDTAVISQAENGLVTLADCELGVTATDAVERVPRVRDRSP